jgi:hypothetical protein
MLDQADGAGVVLVVALAYVLILQAMTAAIVVLAQFTVLQTRHLLALLDEAPRPATVEVHQDQESYRVGGGLLKW